MTQNINNYRHLAILDLGSAAIRFELFELSLDSESPKLKLIEKKRALLRLGHLDSGRISDTKQKELLRILHSIQNILSSYKNIEVVFVATEALRRATNSEDVITACTKVIGHRIDIITPKREATLTVDGILYFEKFNFSKLHFIDIGGKSSEVSFINNNSIEWSISIPFGALMNESTNIKNLLPIHLPKKAEALISQIKIDHPNIPLVGSGGTFRAFDKMLPKLGIVPDDISNNYREAFCLLENATKADFIELTKDQEERRDLLPQGLGILREIIFATDPNDIIVTRFSLRHGLLKELIIPYFPETAQKGFLGSKGVWS